MSFSAIGRGLLLRNGQFFKSFAAKRHILSPAYQCAEDWSKRLDEPLIKDIELGKSNERREPRSTR